ncbi:hypothetical protein [Paraferrimonas sp. SM1919]|uniref:hypothetical protein n=1 Tax=Paraferrimonas sp. SM1919 TaxID=2662263 RepID=UPI0013D22CEA|nr:hypothetical protein [Paraferrimonas sp. SM1919]
MHILNNTIGKTNNLTINKVISGQWQNGLSSAQMQKFNLAATEQTLFNRDSSQWRLKTSTGLERLLRLGEGRVMSLPLAVQRNILSLLNSNNNEQLNAFLGVQKLQNGSLSINGQKIMLLPHAKTTLGNPSLFVDLVKQGHKIFLKVSNIEASFQRQFAGVSVAKSTTEQLLWQQMLRPTTSNPSISKLFQFSGIENLLQHSTIQRALPILNLQELGQIGMSQLIKVYFPNLANPVSSPLTLMLWLWLAGRSREQEINAWQQLWPTKYLVDELSGQQLLQWAKQVSKEQQQIVIGHDQWCFSLPYLEEDEVKTLQVKITKKEFWQVNLRLHIADGLAVYQLKYWPETKESTLTVKSDSSALLRLLSRSKETLVAKVAEHGVELKSQFQFAQELPELLEQQEVYHGYR